MIECRKFHYVSISTTITKLVEDKFDVIFLLRQRMSLKIYRYNTSFGLTHHLGYVCNFEVKELRIAVIEGVNDSFVTCMLRDKNIKFDTKNKVLSSKHKRIIRISARNPSNRKNPFLSKKSIRDC